MPGSLLVPMHVDAMVLNEAQSTATPFARFAMQYRNLDRFESAEPPPFSADSTQPGAGIYLHWTLPQALRRGVEGAAGTIDFPLIPDRWLVVRVENGAAPADAVKAWVLESDYLDPQATSAFLDPTQLGTGGTPIPTRIGRALRFTADTTALPAPPPAAFLRAVAPANAWFAVYEPGVENVLAFHDDMTRGDDVTPIARGAFTYYAIGWYADPAADPLAQAAWRAGDEPGSYVAAPFDWTLFAAEGAALPTSMLVHAVVSGVPWDAGGPTPPPVNFPTDTKNTVKVAVGNTAIDALAAIVRLQSGNGVEADMLEAFYYDVLDRFDAPGSRESLNLAIREQWFGRSDGGTLWTITAAASADGAPPTDAQLVALAALNRLQVEADRQQRILESMQWTLVGLWWKYRWQQRNLPPIDDASYVAWLGTQLAQHVGQGTDPANEAWFRGKVVAQQNLVTGLAAQIAAAKTDLGLTPDQELKAVARPAFQCSPDPVVLVTGLGRSTSYDPVGPVVCRVAAQTLDVLTIDGATYGTTPSAEHDVTSKVPVLADPHVLLPGDVQALHREAFFLSPTLFAEAVLGGASQAGAVETAIENAAKTPPAPAAEFPPARGAYGDWVQPWIPLLLEWEVEVINQPAYDPPPPDPVANPINREAFRFQHGQWSFTGSDFQWVGPTIVDGDNFSESGSAQMTIRGRTFVTPHVSFNLADRLDAFVKHHAFRDPELEALLEDLDRVVDQLESMDVLSQRLSGMTAQLVQRNLDSSNAPTTDPLVSSLSGSDYQGHPGPFPSELSLAAPPPWDFAPLRGSFFVVKKLTVIDNFGRSIDLMLSNFSNDPQTPSSVSEFYFYPIAARDLRVSETLPKQPNPANQQGSTVERMLQLSPRPVQDARVEFPLLSNDGTDTELPFAAGATPICGWVVPNHLDRAFSLYAPDGSAWGELYLSLHYVEGQRRRVPVWQPDPTNPAAPQTLDAIPNRFVRSMFATLAARDDDGRAFDDLLHVIDETLWSINPASTPADQEVPVLTGRPLAIVRARVNLALRGLVWTNQDWWNTFVGASFNDPLPDPSTPVALAQVTGGVETFEWPIRLGSAALRDDGLVGYFADARDGAGSPFDRFYAVHVPEQVASDPYITPIAGNYFTVRLTDDSVAAPSPAHGQAQLLTLLVDPRAGVHAFTGLLPVQELSIPDSYVTEPLSRIDFLFRAGPFLTPPDSIEVPPPAPRGGRWSWFDRVIGAAVPITPEDGRVRFPVTAPLVKEGWLKFVPETRKDPKS